MSTDVIGNFLTIIRNGIMSSQLYVVAPHSKIKHSIAEILKHEGFIKDVVIEEADGKKQLKVFLKYVDGECAIHEIKRMSKLSRRDYKGLAMIKPVIGGLGVSILTTNRGVITNKQAREYGVGGEVICTVW